MAKDYFDHVEEFWPTIMHAWEEFGDKRPVIECDVVKRQVLAWPAREYIDGLSERSRAVTHREYDKAVAGGGIMVFVRDSKRRTFQSHVFMPKQDEEEA